MLDLNQSPYFDDHQQDSTFHKILFRPGYPVQGRELTQTQSIIQSQIDRFGQHVFKDGSKVLGGDTSINYVYYVRVTVPVGESIDSLSEVTVENGTGAIAQTISADKSGISGTTTTDDIVVVNYTTGAQFGIGDTLTVPGTVTGFTVTAVGEATLVSVQEGFFFTGGYFVQCPQQTILVSLNHTATSSVGLNVSDYVLTESDDLSLLDPAYGSSNFNAPGAHRYVIDLELALRQFESGNNSDPSYIELMKLSGGELVTVTKNPKYNQLEDELARRTYDESGSYTVRPFNIRIQENADPEKIDIVLDPGKAYVNGYEFETVGKTALEVNKARDTEFYNNSDAFLTYGLYYICDAITVAMFDFMNLESVELQDGGGTPIGTARVKAVYPSGTNYQVYLMDIQNPGSSSDDVRKIVGLTSLAEATVDITGGTTELLKGTSSVLITEMSPKNPKPGTIDDVNYSTQRTFNRTLDAGGSTTISTNSATERFAGSGTFAGTDPFIEANYIFLVDGVVSTPTTVEIPLVGAAEVGRLVVTFPLVGGSAEIVATIEENDGTQRTKIRRSHSIISTSIGTAWSALAHHDIIKDSVQILDNATQVDITESFQVDDGQRDEFYDFGRVRAVSGTTLVDIHYDYYEHSGVGYFTIDSYAGEEYGDVGVYDSGSRTFDLKSCFDFRPSVAVATVVQIPKSGSSVSFDYEYYLSRADLVVATRGRELKVIRGVPAVRAVVPVQPDGTMALYGVLFNPYTHTITDVEVEFYENRRYTMRDIGKLEKRIQNLEFYTTLSLLETKTSNSAVSGKFRNGFIVDGFTQLDVVEFGHPETNCFLDVEDGTAGPNFNTTDIVVDEPIVPTGVKLTDDGILIRDFSEQMFVEQSSITDFINVNPFAVFSWNGTATLTPSVDTWFDTQRLPDVVNTIGAPQGTSVRQLLNTSVRSSWWFRRTTRTTTTITTRSVLETSASDREVGQTAIPYIRTKDVRVKVNGLLPETTHYIQFDDVDVAANTAPWGTTNFGDPIVTNATGELDLLFRIPAGTFRTGEKLLSISDRTDHDELLNTSFALATYTARGTLLLRQRTITNRWVRRSTTTQRSSVTSQRIRWRDPLAETFLVDENIYPDGLFVSSIDLFFISKDTSAPVTVEIRPTVNGYPDSVQVYPFATAIVEAGDVVVNDRNSLVGFTGTDADKFKATRFTFATPVYLTPGEHCFVVLSNSNNYLVGKAEIGKQIHRSNKVVTENPYGGVLFVSQNASTWTADQSSDLAFNINRCAFEVGESSAIQWNPILPAGVPVVYDAMVFNTALNTFDTVNQTFTLESRAEGSLSTDTRLVNPQVSVLFEERRELDTALDLITTATITSTDLLSPVIDNQDTHLSLIQNEVNNDTTDEEVPYEGAALARYIHKKVELSEDYVADEMRVWFDAEIPAGGSIKVYLKSQNTSVDSTPFSDLGWSEMPTFTIDGNERQYSEVVAGGFTSFQVKVVFLANNPAKVPLIRNFRVVTFQS